MLPYCVLDSASKKSSCQTQTQGEFVLLCLLNHIEVPYHRFSAKNVLTIIDIILWNKELYLKLFSSISFTSIVFLSQGLLLIWIYHIRITLPLSVHKYPLFSEPVRTVYFHTVKYTFRYCTVCIMYTVHTYTTELAQVSKYNNWTRNWLTPAQLNLTATKGRVINVVSFNHLTSSGHL